VASIGIAAATAAVVGLLFAGTIGVDGVAIVWAALSWFDLPDAIVWSVGGLTALAMMLLTGRLTLATWRFERHGEAAGAGTGTVGVSPAGISPAGISSAGR
jgi:hypothetical protein